MNAVTEVGTKVFKSRASSLWPDPDELPCICIFTKDDKLSDRKGIAPDLTSRTLFLSIEIMCADEAANDDTLDSIAKQIEVLLSNDRNLRNTAEDRSLAETTFGFKEDSESKIAAARMTYEIEYLSKAV